MARAARGGRFAAREGGDCRARGELPQRILLWQRQAEQQGTEGSFADLIRTDEEVALKLSHAFIHLSI